MVPNHFLTFWYIQIESLQKIASSPTLPETNIFAANWLLGDDPDPASFYGVRPYFSGASC